MCDTCLMTLTLSLLLYSTKSTEYPLKDNVPNTSITYQLEGGLTVMVNSSLCFHNYDSQLNHTNYFYWYSLYDFDNCCLFNRV